MQLGKIVNPLLARTLKELAVQPMPAQAAYNLVRLSEMVASETNRWKEARETLLNSYCEKDENGAKKVSEDGNSYVLKDSEAFEREYQALIMIEVEGLPQLFLSDLKDCRLSAESMGAIYSLLTV